MNDNNSARLQQQKDRHVIVFAGPNGSGKTTLIDEVKQTGLKAVNRVYAVPEHFINPDQVAKDLQGEFPNQNARDLAAARAAVAQRRQAIHNDHPFAFETVMSHITRISELLTLKAHGYHVVLTFITTDDPEKNVARVTLRYETGTTTGHYVSPDKVRDRYKRTLALLPKAAEIADAVFVYDNSVDFEQATLQALIDTGNGISIAAPAKDWVNKHLVKPLQQREYEKDKIIQTIDHQKFSLIDVDEIHGVYSGKIITTSPYFVAQFDEYSQRAVIHDRLMLDTSYENNPINYQTGCMLEVDYLQGKSAPNINIDF